MINQLRFDRILPFQPLLVTNHLFCISIILYSHTVRVSYSGRFIANYYCLCGRLLVPTCFHCKQHQNNRRSTRQAASNLPALDPYKHRLQKPDACLIVSCEYKILILHVLRFVTTSQDRASGSRLARVKCRTKAFQVANPPVGHPEQCRSHRRPGR
jgi:hypothetical protein